MALSPRGQAVSHSSASGVLTYEDTRSPRNPEDARSPRNVDEGTSPSSARAPFYDARPVEDDSEYERTPRGYDDLGSRSPRHLDGGYAGNLNGGYVSRRDDGFTRHRSVFDDAVVMVGGGLSSLRAQHDPPRYSGRLDARALAQLQRYEEQGDAEIIDSTSRESEEEEAEDDEDVYVTDFHMQWESHYLKRIAKRIHRMVATELTREEEALFMYFVKFDANLDGVVCGEESRLMLEAIEEVAPGTTKTKSDKKGLVSQDGSISFINLLKWFHDKEQAKSTTISFTVSSLGVGLMGSGYLQSDTRLDALSRDCLRRNVVGYRRLLSQVRSFKEGLRLATAREEESTSGLEAAMPAYYEALAVEFEGDSEHLFELFSEVDESGNMMLEESEVQNLLQLLDTSASESDLSRYIAEINLSDGPLSFASLIDWWDQARSVPNSLVAEKGAALLAAVKARAAQRKMSGIFSESCVQVQWKQAKESNRLQALRQAYVRTLSEVREYKMERDLRLLEAECAEL